MARTTRRDETTFTGLVEVYQTPVYNLCYRMLGDASSAEEATLEVFCQAYRGRNSLDAGGPFQTWLFAIAYRRCLHQLRQQNGQVIGAERPWEDGRAAEDPKVRIFLDVLAPDTRAAVILYFWCGLNDEEIAEVMETTCEWVRSRLLEAKKEMAEKLLKDEAYEPYFTGRHPQEHFSLGNRGNLPALL